MKMIYDVTSNVVVENIQRIQNSIRKERLSDTEKEAMKFLLEWSGRYGKEEVAPTIYTKVIYNFMEATFADELGASFESFMKT